MKITIYIILSILVGISFLLFLLPNSKSHLEKKIISKPISVVWKKVRDIKNQTTWRDELKEVNFIDQEKEIWIEKLKNRTEVGLKTKSIQEEKEWIIESYENPLFETIWIGKFNLIDSEKTEIEFEEKFEMKNIKAKLIFYLFIDLKELVNQYINDLEK